MNVTELTPELTALVNAARALPTELVRQVADFAEFLGKKHPAHVAGNEEDEVRTIALASLRNFEAAHPDDDWGTDYSSHPGK